MFTFREGIIHIFFPPKSNLRLVAKTGLKPQPLFLLCTDLKLGVFKGDTELRLQRGQGS